ncbi:hypothetical protein [Streptomyces buecherae]|uniref:hypothetical protein n=1 Tax=Streptomyces buecherae TaxID=2763006 RepID=UPI00379D7CD9
MPNKPSLPKALKSPAGLALSVTFTLLAGAGAWWVLSPTEDTIVTPQKVCDEAISSDALKEVFPKKGEKFREESSHLGTFYGECRVTAGGERASFSYINNPGGEYFRDRIQKKGVPVSLGGAYGYMAPNHVILLYVPCANEHATDRIRVQTGTSMSTQDDAEEYGRAKPVKGDKELTLFTGVVARGLARGPLNCPNADKLPEGPVKIHWP